MSTDLQAFKVQNAPDTVYYIPNFITKEEEQMLLSQVNSAPRTKWTVLSHRRLQNWGGLPGPKGMVGEDLPEWLSVYAKNISNIGAFEGNVPNHVLVNEYKAGQGIMPHEDGPAFYPTVSTISLGSHTLLDFYYHINATSCGIQEAQHKSIAGTKMSASDASSSVPPEGQANKLSDMDCSETCPGECSCTLSTTDKSETHESMCASMAEQGDTTSFESRHFLSLLLQPRSLVLLQDDMYKVHLHGIKEVMQDTVTEKIANLAMVPEVKVGDVLQRETRVSLTIRFVPKVLKSKLIFGKR